MSANGFLLREFRNDDIQSLQTLIHKTIDACYPAVYPNEVIEFFKEHHSAQHILEDASRGHLLILESDGTIIGTGTLFETHVRRVFIDPSYQNRGAGKVIMNELETRAGAEGVSEIDLEASLVSIQFYQSLGYDDHGEQFIVVENGRKLYFRKLIKRLT